jgi:hypothetical protein
MEPGSGNQAKFFSIIDQIVCCYFICSVNNRFGMAVIVIFQKGQVSLGKKFRYENFNSVQDFFHSNDNRLAGVYFENTNI